MYLDVDLWQCKVMFLFLCARQNSSLVLDDDNDVKTKLLCKAVSGDGPEIFQEITLFVVVFFLYPPPPFDNKVIKAII